MKSPKTDLKKVYYIGVIALVGLAILSFLTFYLVSQAHIIAVYLPASQVDAIIGAKSAVYQDLLSGNSIFFFISLTLLIIAVVYAIITFNIYVRKPMKILRESFTHLREGDFDTRIPVKGLKEISELYEEFNQMVKACQKMISIKHYVSSSTKKMVEILNTGEITTQPRRKLVTVFFSDVRGFTSFAENQDPLLVITTINEIFELQVSIIKKHSGDIDKFIGDEIMVEFPTPSLAFKCASEIQAKIDAYNKRRDNPLEVGIGINFGEAIVGAVGSGEQFNWTMVGHTVNIARHLCSIADPGQIGVSKAVYEKLKVKRRATQTDVKMKGLTKPIKAFLFGPG